MINAAIFGRNAASYAAARPSYPDALFDWIADEAPGRELALDVGTGNGQSAVKLAEQFKRVRATDISARQIAEAAPSLSVDYAVAPAHESGLPDKSVDAVTVATALHWFDFPKFWPEVARVAKPGALFAAWTYHRMRTDEEVEEALLRPIGEIVAPYWSEGNRLTWRGYPPEEIGFPFDVIEPPAFEIALNWSASRLVEYVRTWSAHARAREDGRQSTLRRIETDAVKRLGPDARAIVMPLAMLAGRIA
ncbi:MAG: class I SAM-dependent methyltransferase [Pseudomonadota bacterium]